MTEGGPSLSGRIPGGPSNLLHREVLEPQFRYEVEHLLPHYVAIEKVLVAEYLRMGLVSRAQAHEIAALLSAIDADTLRADPHVNLSDISFALELHVERRLRQPVATWHVDRSRNDLQACAQLMSARTQLVDLAGLVLRLGTVVHRLATATTQLPMPGYTHFQAAQVITPGFYLAAVVEQVQHTLNRLGSTHDGMDACPLGSGAMAGQLLAWDRERMARLLGFQAVQPVALTAVASRRHVLEITAELGLLGAALSRFVTDLLTWGSSEYGFIDLPDEFSAVSSAMPQKKNFPVLERIRGRTAHLSAFHLDAVLGQRNTPFSNLVEVSKEAGAHLIHAVDAARSTLTLLTAVLGQVHFCEDRMLAACEREYFGGFALATRLTLSGGVPWRRAQVVAGRYVVAATEAGRPPSRPDGALLGELLRKEGYAIAAPEDVLAAAFDLGGSLENLRSAGSARPGAVTQVLEAQTRELDRVRECWVTREERVIRASVEIDAVLGLTPRHPVPAGEHD